MDFLCSMLTCLSFNNFNAIVNTRGHRFKLNIMRANEDCFKYDLVNRVANVWNLILESCFNTNLIHGFKQRLSKIDFIKYVSDQP